MNVFDKSGAEPNKVRAMPRREKVHGYEQFNEAKRAFVFTLFTSTGWCDVKLFESVENSTVLEFLKNLT